MKRLQFTEFYDQIALFYISGCQSNGYSSLYNCAFLIQSVVVIFYNAQMGPMISSDAIWVNILAILAVLWMLVDTLGDILLR